MRSRFVIIGIAAALPWFVGQATAQTRDRDLLSEGCMQLGDVDKRLRCMRALEALEAAAGTGRPAVAAPSAGYDGLWRPFLAISAATETGVSYLQFGPLVQAAATELAVLRSRPMTDAETEAGDLLASALEAYRDSDTWWDRDIRFYARRDNSLSYGGGLPYDLVGLTYLVAKYGLPSYKADLLGFHQGVPRSVALRKMWGQAAERVAEARKLLQPAEPEKPR